MAKRKTISIEVFVDQINNSLATHTGGVEYGEGLVAALEEALRLANRYRGFRYLEQNEVPEGHLPGIYWKKNQQGKQEADFTNTNKTRVHYF